MSGEQPEADSKTQEATPSRVDKARSEGDVAQSREANIAASYAGFFVATALFGGATATALAAHLAAFQANPAGVGNALFPADGARANADIIWTSAIIATPIIAAPALAVLTSLFAQRAIAFAPSKLSPKFSRISPAANAKNKFGPSGMVEFLKGAAKLLVVIIIFASVFAQQFSAMPGEALKSAHAIPAALQSRAILFVGAITLFAAIIAALDIPWSLHEHAKRLRMTAEEVKREQKENEGDPAMKQSRRDRAQAAATNSMLRDVPTANVVIVNPVHYAVALAWSPASGSAPVCVAKGVDALALKIREIAAANGVPIRHDAPAARGLHASVEVGEEIRREHFAAVAAAIHFAEEMRKKAKNGA